MKATGGWGKELGRLGRRGRTHLDPHLCLLPAPQVCGLDIIFNFEKACFILDEFLMGGDVQDTSKKSVLKAIEQADLLQEVQVRDR